MRLEAGSKLGPYEILAPLGAGGMGEVYRARDPRLGRDVAIKVLPADRLADESRRRRFAQEARAASALNHPNIVTIHEIDSIDDTDFIVMELVSGKTLADLIRPGMRLQQALKIAIPVADALAKAHAAGIVHRDLKPANVMVSDDGAVKVLDFGLAKLIAEGSPGSDDGVTATAEASLTGSGTITGTPGYMSPEQATGGTVDSRTDVFSFGALLYEMVTGRRAFAGNSTAETLAKLLTTEPAPPSTFSRDLPQELEKLILRCLHKEPERRLQHMDDLKLLLEEVRDGLGRRPNAARASTQRPRSLALLAVAAALVLLTAASLWRGRARPAQPVLVPVTALSGTECCPSLSPDGSQVAFSWEGERRTSPATDRDIWLKLVNGTEIRRLTSGPEDDWNPSWSPDGSQVAFLRFAKDAFPLRGEVYVVSALGGAARRVADITLSFSQLSWSPDGRWLAVGGRVSTSETDAPEAAGVRFISATGGEVRAISKPQIPGMDLHPALSPDGRRLAYVSCSFTGRPACELVVLDLDQKGEARSSPRTLSEKKESLAGVAWTRDGRSLVYAQSFNYFQGRGIGSRLWRVAADGSRPPERIELAPIGSFAPATTPARDVLLFTHDRSDFDIYGLETGGTSRPVMASTFLDYAPRFSPDGRRIVFESSRFGDTKNIWVADPDGSNATELTRPPGEEGGPAWSPDGNRIVFIQDRSGELWTMNADGGSARRLVGGDGVRYGPPVWSRDGRWIYCRQDRQDGQNVVRIPAAGGPPERITQTGPLIMVEESPDGRSLFFTKSEETGALFSVSLATRVERRVEDCVYTRGLASTSHAFYYVGCSEDRQAPVYRLDAATGQRRLFGMLDRAGAIMGLTVSPDEKKVLYGREVPWNSDLMMIENFR